MPIGLRRRGPLYDQMTDAERAIVDGVLAPGEAMPPSYMPLRIGIAYPAGAPPGNPADLDAAVAQNQRIGIAVDRAGNLRSKGTADPRAPILRNDPVIPASAPQEVAMANPWEVTPEMEARQAMALEAAGLSPTQGTYDSKIGPKLEQIGIQRLKGNNTFQAARSAREDEENVRRERVTANAQMRGMSPQGRDFAQRLRILGGEGQAGPPLLKNIDPALTESVVADLLLGPGGGKMTFAARQAGLNRNNDLEIAKIQAGAKNDPNEDRNRLRVKIALDNPTWAQADIEAEVNRILGAPVTPQPGGASPLPAPLPRPPSFGDQVGGIDTLAEWQDFLRSRDPSWFVDNAPLLEPYVPRIRGGMSPADLEGSLTDWRIMPPPEIVARNNALRAIFGLQQQKFRRDPWDNPMPDPSIIPRQKFMP